MSKTVNSKIQIRRDTANNWSTNNPILAAGEIGFDLTNGKHKIGDGSNNWSSLPYFVLDNEIVGYQTAAQVESAIAQNAEIVVVNLTPTHHDDVTTYTADKTFAELYAAHAAGKTLILYCTSANSVVYHLYYVSSTLLRFSSITPVTFILNVFEIKSDNTVRKLDSVSAVRSVNNKKGNVTLTYSDVGALPDSTVIPTKVSDLNNDSGFQTQAQVNALIAAAGDDDTTYAISMSGNVITLTGSDGNTSTVTLPVYTGGVV